MEIHTSEFVKPARKIVEECFALQPKEQLLVITDTQLSKRIGESLVAYAGSLGNDASILTFPAREYIPDKPWVREDPPTVISESMKFADAVFIYTTVSLSYSNARKEANSKGVRVLSAPRMQEEEFLRTSKINFVELSALTRRVSNLQMKAKKIRIKTDAGTDISWEQDTRETLVVDGLCRDKGNFTQLPPGASACVPVQGSAEGKVVIDGMLHGISFPLRDPVTLEVKNGKITRIDGGFEARQLEHKMRDANDPNAYNYPAEWAVGTNSAAVMVPEIEGERCYGCINTGIGANSHIPGGKVLSRFHLDGVMLDPTLIADGQVVLQKRVFKI